MACQCGCSTPEVEAKEVEKPPTEACNCGCGEHEMTVRDERTGDRPSAELPA
jgi:hypothetical protein